MSRTFLSVVAIVSILTSGCSAQSDSITRDGLVGAVAGAGTGAIVGSVIANGDVAASALLGTAIGIPVGIALGAIIYNNSQAGVRERKVAQINKNNAELFARQRELDSLREKIRNDGPTGNPSEQLREYQYNGDTLGNYYR